MTRREKKLKRENRRLKALVEQLLAGERPMWAQYQRPDGIRVPGFFIPRHRRVQSRPRRG